MTIYDSKKEKLRKEIFQTFPITHGNIKKTAELLGIDQSTVYNYCSLYPDLEEQLLQSRKGMVIHFCDVAEEVIQRVMKMVEERPGYAFQSAKYYLECQAKNRGWGVQTTDSLGPPLDQDIDYKVQNMRQQHEIEVLKDQLNAYKSKTEQESSGSDTQI